MDIKVATLNVRGLNNNDKRNIIYSWIRKESYDICLLQESYCTLENSEKFKRGWKGDMLHSYSDSTHSRGVSILFNRKLDYTVLSSTLFYTVLSSHTDKDGRMILVNLTLNNDEFTLVNIYAPNSVSERIAFFNKMKEFIQVHAVNRSKLIIAGDFNCVLSTVDCFSGVVDKSTKVLTDIIENLSLVDIWRNLNPELLEFTYVDPSPNMCNSRIDMILCSNTLKSLCLSSKICQSPAPDHKVVNVHLATKQNVRGRGYWKMNNSALESEEYEKGIKNLYTEVISEYGQDVPKSLLWDYMKVKIKEFSIAFGIQKAQNYRDKCQTLESLLDSLDQKLTKGKDDNVLTERKGVKDQLDEYYKEKSQGYQNRSRANWVEQGEQSTKYFLGLEKARQNFNCISSLKDCNGITLTTDKEILEVAKTFYSDLYKSKSTCSAETDHTFDSVVPEKVLTADS